MAKALVGSNPTTRTMNQNNNILFGQAVSLIQVAAQAGDQALYEKTRGLLFEILDAAERSRTQKEVEVEDPESDLVPEPTAASN